MKTMYNEAVAGIKKHLLNRSTPSNLLYIQELPSGLNGPYVLIFYSKHYDTNYCYGFIVHLKSLIILYVTFLGL